MRSSTLIAAIVMALAGLSFSNADAATFYVSTTGSDNNGGTSLDDAFLTLAKAVEAAGAEATEIFIAPGEYPQSAAIRVEAPIVICGLRGSEGEVVLKNTTAGQRVVTLAHDDAELAEVTLTGGSASEGPACLGIEAGLVRDCKVTGCSYKVARERSGGTVVMSGGRISRAVICGNSAISESWEETFSAGIYATAGVIENCLIMENSSSSRNEKRIETSALSLSGTAQAVNCTIVGNKAKWKDNDSRVPMTTYAGGNAKIINCVIFGNTCDIPKYAVWAGTAANYINCFSEVAINDTCLAIVDPGFADPDNGDYTPTYASPLRDAGSDAYYNDIAVSTTDIWDSPRILNGSIDIGAFEYIPGLWLEVDFSYTVNRQLLPASVTFTAEPVNVSGPVTYQWDFDSDGTIDRETTEAVITVDFAVAKMYDVTLKAVSEQEVATAVKRSVFRAIQKDIYVSLAGSGQYPYATPETAATTIHEALESAVGGCVVHVLPGTYPQNLQLTIDKAVTLVSTMTNAADVILRNTASNQRIVEVSHENAELAGITLTNGKGSPRGAALTMTAGIVRDCIVTGNSTGGAKGDTSGAVWMSGGRLMRCQIVGNSGGTGWNADCGGGVNATGGIVESCLVATNRVNYWGDSYTTALGVKLAGTAKAINCTIANNICNNPDESGCFPMATYASANARFINCVIWGNVTKPGDTTKFVWHGTASSYVNCYSELSINETSPAVTIPGFVDVSANDYSLVPVSPLVNKGMDYAAAGGISEFDLAGKARNFGKGVDIGCYECQSMPGFFLIVR